MEQISRADILRFLLKKQEKQGLPEYAEFFGYEWLTRVEEETELNEYIETPLPNPKPKPSPSSTELTDLADFNLDFQYPVLRTIEKRLVTQGQKKGVEEDIAWLQQRQEHHEFKDELLKQEQPKDSRLLFNWQLLKERLQEVLFATQKGLHIDIELVIQKISKAEPLRELPRETIKRQASDIRLITDYAAKHLKPVFDDFTELSQKIKHLYGEHYVQPKVLKQQENIAALLQEHQEKGTLSYLQGVKTVIVISDLGLYLPNDDVLDNWLTFAKIAYSYSCKPIALLPVPAYYLDARVTATFACINIESAEIITIKSSPDLERRQNAILDDQEKAKLTLLSALSSSPYIDPSLLRATRDLFDSEECNLAAEVLSWTHPDVHSGSSHICLRQKKQQAYLNRLKSLTTSMQKNIRQNFIDFHGRFLIEDLVIELSILNEVCGFNDEINKYCIVENRNIARRLRSNPDKMRKHFSYWLWNRYFLEQEKEAKYTRSSIQRNYASVLYALTKDMKPDTPIESWVNKKVFSQIMEELFPTEQHNLKLLRFPNYLLLTESKDTIAKDTKQNSLSSQSNLIIQFSCQAEGVFVKGYYKNGIVKNLLLRLSEHLPYKLSTVNLESLTLEFPENVYHLVNQSKPEWTKAIFSDPKGTAVKTKLKADNHYWYPNVVIKQNVEKPERRGYWYPAPQLTKPVWADTMDNDVYGLYADLAIKRVKQRFRWIEPGEFWMGSPEDEAERFDREVLHKVRLTQGFWLADTACTQALWKAVMRKNPSNLKGDKLPVEKVSWEDAKVFIEN